MSDYKKEYQELKIEFDRLFNQLYLALEEKKRLEKENKKLEKAVNKLSERVVDLSSRLGIKPSI